MKKERHIDFNTKNFIITAVLTGFLLIICTLALTEKFLPKFENDTYYIWYSIFIAIILIPSGFIFLINLYQFAYFHYRNYKIDFSDIRDAQKVNHNLGNDFSNVQLKHWDSLLMDEIIPEDCVICTAKLAEDGTIIYTVNVNVERCTNDYKWFLKKFKI